MAIRSIVSCGIVLAAACGHVNNAPDADVHIDTASNQPDAKPAIDAPATVDANEPDAGAAMTFTNASGWVCAQGVDCEDTYDFDLAAGAKVTVNVTSVTGFSVPRLGLFAGQTTTGTNLFNNATTTTCAPGQDVNFAQGPTSVAAGHYRVTVGRDWGNSGDASGTYVVTITTTANLSNAKQTSDDTASNQGHCP